MGTGYRLQVQGNQQLDTTLTNLAKDMDDLRPAVENW